MTTVKTLLGLPGLRLRRRAGEPELLERPVTRIYVTELPDPGRYLSAGELVLSGLLWWREPGDAEGFVASLASAGAVALAASGADSGGIPDDLVEACTKHRIPLFEVPTDLSFSVITEQVVLALAAASDQARKRLHAATTLPGLLETAATELGLPCWVLSTIGRVVQGTAPLPLPAAEVVRRYTTGSGPLTVLEVEDDHPVRWLVAAGGPLTPAQTELAGELAALVAAARARPAPPAPPDGDVRVLAVRTEGSAEAADVAAELVAGLPAQMLDAAMYAVSGPLPDVLGALSTVEPLLSARRVLCGISDPVPASDLAEAREVARYAVDVAAARPGTVEVVPGGEIDVHELLLAGAPEGLRAAVRRRVLGPLLAYDADQHTDLVHTVRVFLECSGSPTRAAKALHIHVNTLRYRIGRASELLGTDLADFRDQLDVYLALRAGDHPG